MASHTSQSTLSTQEEQERNQQREEFDRAEYALATQSSNIDHARCMLRAIRAHLRI